MKEIIKGFIKHLPEVLTVTSIVGIPIGDALLVSADRKYQEDGKKIHYILPITIHVGSAVCIVASNRVSNAQKVSLLAAGALSASQMKQYQQVVKKEVGDDGYQEIQNKFEDLDLDRLMIEADEADELNFEDLDNRKIFYFPQLHEMVICTEDELQNGLRCVNESIQGEDVATVLDFFFGLGDVPMTHSNDDICKANHGWRIYDGNNDLWYTDVTLERNTKKVRSGREVTYCYFTPEPLRDDEWPDQFKEWEAKIEEETMNHG